ncbi:RNA methyltransferase [Candidatus Symbiobacter mobilis]|uniref:RNA methyltransferase n=1 Tax=Candidatus Symbiobacter mobilis CR TaxID=946483 RepID=U5N598_9BURK|nr:RNA methyltransferase [Candidatus Symbiobacter mobilis]AGX86430.1 RNA methyltransferase [Candidatus Symbiobacter mobilis CR]
MHTRFILIEPSHAGNVGACARAIRTMGFDDLVLVRPRWPDVLRRAEAIERAGAAWAVLESARIVDRLDDALDGIDHLCATAMTPRDFGPHTLTPRAHFEELLRGCMMDAPPRTAPPAKIALLFGPERFGMRNEDVYRCHACLQIPSDPDCASLNLGAAVQVIAYEWRMALGAFPITTALPPAQMADAAQVEAMLGHWLQALCAVGFFDPRAPKKLLHRLRRLMLRARPTQEEIHILRGIARSILRNTHDT